MQSNEIEKEPLPQQLKEDVKDNDGLSPLGRDLRRSRFSNLVVRYRSKVLWLLLFFLIIKYLARLVELQLNMDICMKLFRTPVRISICLS